MRINLRTTAIATAVVTLAAAGPALAAATTVTVTAGNQTSGTTTFTAATIGSSPQITFLTSRN